MLTELSCKSLITESKRAKKPLKKSDGRGLLLHAFPNGSAYWYHKYSYYGQHRQLAYGQYPLVSLAEARARHATSYLLITSGTDPFQLRQVETEKLKEEAMLAKNASNRTFEAISNAWHTRNLKKWSPAHAANIMRRLRKNLFPDLGSVPIEQITRKRFLSVLRQVEQRSPEDARRCVQYATYIFNDAVDEEYITTNIALGIEKSLAPQIRGHYASMDITDLPKFLADLSNNVGKLSADRKDAIELLMLTVVRPNELVRAEWSEFDFEKELWVIPKERMKMRQDHIVPLSQQAKAILLKRWNANIAKDSPHPKSKYVFPSRLKPWQPLAHNTICDIIIDMGWKGRHTGHGFRALFMGVAKEELKYRHEAPDRQLAHRPKGDVNRAYDRAQFLDERKMLMQEYADYIDRKRQPIAK
ncbi:MAG: tyrosine-type recombinase/integrase [Chitinophagaceae bacterium]|nr:tyrosine-type recombinase/integrase [Chitinophagaceae bacterium]